MEGRSFCLFSQLTLNRAESSEPARVVPIVRFSSYSQQILRSVEMSCRAKALRDIYESTSNSGKKTTVPPSHLQTNHGDNPIAQTRYCGVE
jgi:hypothetical protein